jgi:hypothetical protein
MSVYLLIQEVKELPAVARYITTIIAVILAALLQ